MKPIVKRSGRAADPILKRRISKLLREENIAKRSNLVSALREKYPGTGRDRILRALQELKREDRGPFLVRYGKFVYRLPYSGSLHIVTKRAPIRGKPTLHKLLLRHLVEGKLVSPGLFEQWYGICHGTLEYNMNHMERQVGQKLRFKRVGRGGEREPLRVGQGPFTAREKTLMYSTIRKYLEGVAASSGNKAFKTERLVEKVRQAAERKGFMRPVTDTIRTRYCPVTITRYTLRLLKEEGNRWRGRINREQIPSMLWNALVGKKRRKRK